MVIKLLYGYQSLFIPMSPSNILLLFTSGRGRMVSTAEQSFQRAKHPVSIIEHTMARP